MITFLKNNFRIRITLLEYFRECSKNLFIGWIDFRNECSDTITQQCLKMKIWHICEFLSSQYGLGFFINITSESLTQLYTLLWF